MGQGTNAPPQTAGFGFGWSGPNMLGGPAEGGPGNPIRNAQPWTNMQRPTPPNWLQTSATSALQQELGRKHNYANEQNVMEGNFLMRQAMHNALRFDPATGRMHAGTVNEWIKGPVDPRHQFDTGYNPGHFQAITDPSDPRYWNVGPLSRYSEGALANLERQDLGKKKQWKF